MAKIVEDIIVIKFSKIVKNNETDPTSAMSNDQIESLTLVVAELVDVGVVVEIERA